MKREGKPEIVKGQENDAQVFRHEIKSQKGYKTHALGPPPKRVKNENGDKPHLILMNALDTVMFSRIAPEGIHDDAILGCVRRQGHHNGFLDALYSKTSWGTDKGQGKDP